MRLKNIKWERNSICKNRKREVGRGFDGRDIIFVERCVRAIQQLMRKHSVSSPEIASLYRASDVYAF